jgi:hypothetical protein
MTIAEHPDDGGMSIQARADLDPPTLKMRRGRSHRGQGERGRERRGGKTPMNPDEEKDSIGLIRVPGILCTDLLI